MDRVSESSPGIRVSSATPLKQRHTSRQQAHRGTISYARVVVSAEIVAIRLGWAYDNLKIVEDRSTETLPGSSDVEVGGLSLDFLSA